MAFLRRIWNKWQNLLYDEKLKHKIYVIILKATHRWESYSMWR